MRPIRSPTLLLIRMNAADTSASSAIAACTPLTVVSRSSTTAEIETFISEVSTTSTNIAIANNSDSLGLPRGLPGRRGAFPAGSSLIRNPCSDPTSLSTSSQRSNGVGNWLSVPAAA